MQFCVESDFRVENTQNLHLDFNINADVDSDILFTFVLEGQMTLEGEGRDPFDLAAGDAFVVPPNMPTCYSNASSDLELLEVSLPGRFATNVVET